MPSTGCGILSPHEQRVLEEQQGIHSYAGRERVFAILNSFKGTRPTIDVERAALFTESMRQTEGQHLTLRWAKALKHIAEHTNATYVITNNHFQGKAIANALQLVNLISNRPAHVPEILLRHYPELESIAIPVTPGALPHQVDLFVEGPPPSKQ